MARSHHRKKHKEHLRQFKHKGDTASSTPKSKAAGIFTIGGVIIGLAVSYFGTQGSFPWIIAGITIGGIAGFLLGRKVDTDTKA